MKPWLVAIALVVAACTPAAGPSGDAWRFETLVDARSGEPFAIADFEGSVVLLETMASWCVTCRISQAELREAIRLVGPDRFVAISVGIDPNETGATLAAYAGREGFDWRFAPATPSFARALSEAFGAQVLSAPATPTVLIGPAGDVLERHLGVRPADAIAASVLPHLP